MCQLPALKPMLERNDASEHEEAGSGVDESGDGGGVDGGNGPPQ